MAFDSLRSPPETMHAADRFANAHSGIAINAFRHHPGQAHCRRSLRDRTLLLLTAFRHHTGGYSPLAISRPRFSSLLTLLYPLAAQPLLTMLYPLAAQPLATRNFRFNEATTKGMKPRRGMKPERDSFVSPGLEKNYLGEKLIAPRFRLPHRIGGGVLVAHGLAILLAGFRLPVVATLAVVFVGGPATVIWSMFYSRSLARAEARDADPTHGGATP
jgi:hypothetical protein